MTTPQERFRALRWAREWLVQVNRDPLVPPEAKTKASEILSSYPPDQRLRALIDDKAIGLPIDVAMPLMTASRWIFEFLYPTSEPNSLGRVRRHLPTHQEIYQNIRAHEPDHLLVDWRTVMGVHHWLEQD